MTVAFVKKSARVAFGGGSTASPSLASVGAGNLVVLKVGASRGDTANTAISPPSGWAAAQNPAGPAIGGSPNYCPVVAIFYKLSSAGGTESATVTLPSGSYGWAQISEYSGGPFTFTGAQSASAVFNTGATSRATGTTGANSIADAVVIAVGHPEDTIGNTSALTTPAGWTSLDLEPTNSIENAWSAAYKILSSTGTQSATHNWTTNSYYAGAIAIFEGPSGGGGGGVTGAGQIASGEALGTPAVGAFVAPAGIASAQAFGAPVVAASIAAAGIASGEQVGQPAIGAGIAAAGVASAQALGAPTVGAGIGAAGIASAETIGAPAVSAAIAAAGIASGEAFGGPVVNGAGIFAAGIPSAEGFGQPAIAARISAAGIASGEAVGSPLVGTPDPAPQRFGSFEMVGRRLPERNIKPLLHRVLDRRYPRVKPAKERAARRAKAIEQTAAQLVADDPQNLARFDALMRQWMAERPVPPPGLDLSALSALFEAQVGFRLRQLQLEQQARDALAAAQARDDEDALAVIFLLS